jgi:hypothetical protein
VQDGSVVVPSEVHSYKVRAILKTIVSQLEFGCHHFDEVRMQKFAFFRVVERAQTIV